MAAAERIFTELYSDAAAHDAIASALTLLPTRNPREIKRFVNVFRFYTFVSQMHRLRGYPAATGDQVAKVAAFSIRWPQVVGLLFAPPTDDAHPLVTLDLAARDEADSWWQSLKEIAPSLRHHTEQPAWCHDLREFLRADPEINEAAARLL